MYNILISDDDKFEREGIIFLIDKYKLPLRIFEAENGEKALEVIKREAIHVLLTDIKMPLMNGMELAKQARYIKKDLKIIIISAYGEFDYAKEAINLDVINYILKPVDVDEFLNVINKVIRLCDKNRMLINMIKETSSQEDEKIEQSNDRRKVIENIINIVNNEYMNNISVESIAQKVYLTPNYVSILFKKEMNMTLIKFLTLVRLNKGKELLEATNLRSSEICQKVGYSNQSYFNTLFKNHTGLSPAKYREKVR